MARRALMSLVVALSVVATSNAVTTTNLRINELLINPPSGSDESQGREYIELKGTPSGDLTGFAIVIVENEHSGGGTDDRGSIDTIIPLDGQTLGSNGILVIRDTTGTGGATGSPAAFSPAKLAASNEWDIDFSKTHAATATLPAWGGQGLENGGGNYYVVSGLHKTVVNTAGSTVNVQQKVESPPGTRTQTGTLLDSTNNGILDFMATSPGTATAPWDQIYDFVYIANGDSGSNTQNFQALPQAHNASASVDYWAGGSKWLNGKFVFFPVQTAAGGWTPDIFWRLNDTLGLGCDISIIATNYLGYNASVDPAEIAFSDPSLNGLPWMFCGSGLPGSTAYATPGSTGNWCLFYSTLTYGD